MRYLLAAGSDCPRYVTVERCLLRPRHAMEALWWCMTNLYFIINRLNYLLLAVAPTFPSGIYCKSPINLIRSVNLPLSINYTNSKSVA